MISLILNLGLMSTLTTRFSKDHTHSVKAINWKFMYKNNELMSFLIISSLLCFALQSMKAIKLKNISKLCTKHGQLRFLFLISIKKT